MLEGELEYKVYLDNLEDAEQAEFICLSTSGHYMYDLVPPEESITYPGKYVVIVDLKPHAFNSRSEVWEHIYQVRDDLLFHGIHGTIEVQRYNEFTTLRF